MTGGVIAQRLIELAKALVGWMPGGLAIATVGARIIRCDQWLVTGYGDRHWFDDVSGAGQERVS